MEIDVQQQWRDLEETYGQMADEEIESLAAQAYELTDFAKQALQHQIKSRGLKVELSEAPPASEGSGTDEPQGDLDPADLELVHCSDVWNAEEARTIMGALYNAGVPAYIGPSLIEKVDEFHGHYEDGVEIKVRDVDRQRAYRALSLVTMPDTGESKDDPGDYQARCPKCNSEEIVFLELDESPSQPQPGSKFHWHCDSCGNDWEDDGIEEK